jgi:hypothetical protein
MGARHMNSPKVIEGQWYADAQRHDWFCVIAVDEQEGLIDVRDGHGEIDELDFDEWEAMGLELCATPPSWSAASDDED